MCETISSREISWLTFKSHYKVIGDINTMLKTLPPNSNVLVEKRDFNIETPTETMISYQYSLNKEAFLAIANNYSDEICERIIKQWGKIESAGYKLPKTFINALKLQYEHRT